MIWLAGLEQNQSANRCVIDAMEAEVTDGTDVAEESQGEANAVVVPEFVRKFGDLDLSKVREDSNGMVGMLYGLYSDHIAFKVDAAMVDNIVSCSMSVESETGNPTPRSSHNEGWVAASVLDGSTNEGSGVVDWCAQGDESKATRAVDETRRNCD